MLKYSIYFFCFIIISQCLVSNSFAKEPVGSIYEKRCTINTIEGPIVQTSCQEFTIGEEVKITDISGRSFMISQLPLPCEALIEYTCISDEKCNSIVSINVRQKIKEVPE